MINLSEQYRKSPRVNLVKKLKSFRTPDVYLVENLLDFQENASKLVSPLCKRFPWVDDTHHKAYINIHNVGLKKYILNGIEKKDYFMLHDDTGAEVFYWNKDNTILPAIHSFEEVQEEQGLKDDDWVYEIFMRYSMKNELTSMIAVYKDEFSNTQEEKESELSTFFNIFPEIRIQSQPKLIPRFTWKK